jgi:hypothetical protein
MNKKTVKDIINDIDSQRREAIIHLNTDALRILLEKNIITQDTFMRDINKILFFLATNVEYPKIREQDEDFMPGRRKKKVEEIAPEILSVLPIEEEKKKETTPEPLPEPEPDPIPEPEPIPELQQDPEEEDMVVIDMDEEEQVLNDDGEEIGDTIGDEEEK